ncbi:MAG: ABC transporter substrate-binding protein [Planctomycetaceae bacterium]|jgi:iron complex transport system substrate-binding protein|nr:ABC transporter substrate-binding protein [Planctomycetaceae bacterium]
MKVPQIKNFFLFLAIPIFFASCVQQNSKTAQKEELRPIRTIEQWENYQKKGLAPKNIERIFCSGGTLRLAVYLQCADRVIATDGNERNESNRNGMKAYLAAHPELATLPIAGESSGRDNPELLLSLKNPPQLIIKADTGAGYDPEELTRRTGIPVALVPMRGITVGRAEFDAGLRLMGTALNQRRRAEEVITFFDNEIAELKKRTTGIAEETKPAVYVGGVSYNGSHGFNSSEAGYPPFDLVKAREFLKNHRNDPILGNRHQIISKEKILEWNPDAMFLDLGTLGLQNASGLSELQNDSSYRSLAAVQSGKVYALLPNTFYFVNHDAVLANGWFVGKTLYPDRFADIDPKKKADEIFTFLVGKPVFQQLNENLQNLAFERLTLN